MDLMSWLRRLGPRPDGEEDDASHLTHWETTPAEDELRERLAADPNDQVAFDALVDVVRERAEEDVLPDPLTAGTPDAHPERFAVWALAEEIAKQPRAWLPLVVLAELSLEDDHESAIRRLNLAVEREDSGAALAHAVAMLRDSGNLSDAVTFGVAHWESAVRTPAAGEEVVLAALESGRVEEGRRLYDSLVESLGDASKVKKLGREVERAEAAAAEA